MREPYCLVFPSLALRNRIPKTLVLLPGIFPLPHCVVPGPDVRRLHKKSSHLTDQYHQYACLTGILLVDNMYL